ncbi:unnamed protein product [Lampetra fluviatilis]
MWNGNPQHSGNAQATSRCPAGSDLMAHGGCPIQALSRLKLLRGFRDVMTTMFFAHDSISKGLFMVRLVKFPQQSPAAPGTDQN